MKNPFMSMFLSQANRAAGHARGHATAAVKREAAKNMTQMTRTWTNAFFPLTSPPKKRRTGRK
ncbi:MAG: hypothetical protein H7244_01400 [Herminiimonas sp.]|nr:hypothetical protein [Herminiimonas sp.]